MRIVLLCGGSGKRLWPLSNEIRSKVFLKLLKSEDGASESMIGRICRQLDEVGLLQSTCIVTHQSQVEITRNHVGEHIPIIGEPNKRGTFTAVALAACYLQENMQVDPNETICILPVDTYVDTEFFRMLHRFPDVLLSSKADLALLGTTPAKPSDQFGYIVPVLPKENDEYSFVHQFIEKPNESAASRLIEQQAMWNCGVFAFSLKFMLAYLKDKGHPVQVDAWLTNYEQLANLSFDREVVELTLPAVVIRYEGAWSDLGSWTALSVLFEDNVIGAGRISDDSVNTHLINELPYPIEIIGIPDIIVAANFDGILIANKDKSNLIKERLAQAPQFPMYGEKRWGSYRVLKYWKDEMGNEAMIKIVNLTQGRCTSYHQHLKRQESLTILSGIAEILLEDKLCRLLAGDVLQIPPGAKHGIKAVTDLELMEVLLGSELSHEDINRFAINW
ncbi:sugar phosphate nucleotidyltransferase [Paenibacillus aceris]|uniref:Mannose-1-phosphate guanylyltransferase n=1 Tax=Paenibacillus aceris TaxID=869555 RepID=A0ABS4I032_9BACL|nr:sugar phosphate nucleotidyltransferase [Paenibacillus aceris]MBP1964276.1 mannose-1-phosphate guanylyltransferase [Paenibacillus aceris]NHW36597.1 mannose-1-phosphate guanylyltransferase [Paenibacillus aceris]